MGDITIKTDQATGDVEVTQATVSKDKDGADFATSRSWTARAGEQVDARGRKVACQVERHLETFRQVGVSQGDRSALADFASERQKQLDS